MEKCEEIEREYREIPGFSLPEVWFTVTPWPCSGDGAALPGTVYYVAHSFMDADGREDNDSIGVFASRKEAEAAREAYSRSEKAARRRLGGNAKKLYLLDQTDSIPYEINKKHWAEGFTTDCD